TDRPDDDADSYRFRGFLGRLPESEEFFHRNAANPLRRPSVRRAGLCCLLQLRSSSPALQLSADFFLGRVGAAGLSSLRLCADTALPERLPASAASALCALRQLWKSSERFPRKPRAVAQTNRTAGENPGRQTQVLLLRRWECRA